MNIQHPWAGKKVLIVDDSAIARVDIRRAFEQTGLNIIGEAENGVQALEMLKTLKPDLLSLDIIMPEMHGIDCFRRSKALNPELKYIFISCLAGESGVISSFNEEEIPGYLFLPKPVAIGQLETRLAKIFGVKKESSEENKPTPVAS